MNLDWRNIRPLNGSRSDGFEELCAQLARAVVPAGADFVRKGAPDAGVECYAVLSDGTEWAWQAKYFDTLGNSQWTQIDRSVRTAIEKHPRLVRYYICTPLDRPDARVDGQKSAMDKWDEYVKKWTELATARGMTVDFVYWGSHELLERLADPKHVGRVYFWFDKRGFDPSWFRNRLDEAISAAGPRYTPELHVDLPMALKFEAFGRTEHFFNHQKAYARGIRRSLQYLTRYVNGKDTGVATATVLDECEKVLASIGAVENQPAGQLPFESIVKQIRATEREAEKLAKLLVSRDDEPGPIRDLRIYLVRLLSELRSAHESFVLADQIANSSLMILRGGAGVGKTHLLCDVARQRVYAGLPTILLMGQQFLSNAAPWFQARQHLDLAHISVEQFVGALEAAAQAAGTRALLIIDALNEGAGPAIWPTHLAPFLAQVERSPWIGVVLAVRSSHENVVIPEEVRERAVVVTHEGFGGHEYDAAQSFFAHYGLELPSTPLLTPEFRNPLFLKTLCKGLKAKGVCRVPRGLRGITAVFDLYINAVNESLANRLNFDPLDRLVHKALRSVVETMLDSGESWLIRDRAKEVVNSLLPGREYTRSLYTGLVAEDVLVEDTVPHQDELVVYINYERFADYVKAKHLLDKHLDARDPAAAFVDGGALAFLSDENSYVSPGLLEALCVQLPERTGLELPKIVPGIWKRWNLGGAFRQSLIWRNYAAFSDDTIEVLEKLCDDDGDVDDAIEVLLTVAVLPEHPLNARFLDRRLRDYAMPDRDAWWSVYLHHAWDTHGAVDRLVDWASSLSPATKIEDETVDLCAITLSWMLTTSNRFLRDRATKALVNILTGRLGAATRLVKNSADVDDPYVAERVYAVAYGVAMRSHDPDAVGELAQVVYDRVFAGGNPPAHILLRDYARGVIERALYLGADTNVEPERIRPPYNSTWPTIPSEDEIKSLVSDWSGGSYDAGDLEWGRNRIANSVLHDDFAHYVIGTNWSTISRQWLNLKLDELSGKPAEITDQTARRSPGFDMRLVQRYILWRVFDLGWTIERFGHFDRFSIGYHGREASKAERIGKKYQWIAYHEMMAYMADRFQYRDSFVENEGGQVYDGPWQGSLRDIDPSSTIKSVRGGTGWESHAPAWWAPVVYDEWGDPDNPRDWVAQYDDVPKVEDLLLVTQPESGLRWLNLHGYFNWRQEPPPDRDALDVELREFWYICAGYLIHADDATIFMEWAEEVDFWGDWMPKTDTLHRMFLGEHIWSPAARYFRRLYGGNDGWVQPDKGCPVKVKAVALEYPGRMSGFDCSIDEEFTLRLPVDELVTRLGVRWCGQDLEFVDLQNDVVIQDPTVRTEGPSALLFRQDALQAFLERENLTVCWVVIGEKRVFPPGFGFGPRHPAQRMSGAYVLSGGCMTGFVKHMLDEPGGTEGDDSPGVKVIGITRTKV